MSERPMPAAILKQMTDDQRRCLAVGRNNLKELLNHEPRDTRVGR